MKKRLLSTLENQLKLKSYDFQNSYLDKYKKMKKVKKAI